MKPKHHPTYSPSLTPSIVRGKLVSLELVGVYTCPNCNEYLGLHASNHATPTTYKATCVSCGHKVTFILGE